MVVTLNTGLLSAGSVARASEELIDDFIQFKLSFDVNTYI